MGWAWTRLKDIAFITKLAGFEYSKYIEPNLCENGIPLFKGKNVQNSEIIYEFEGYIPEEVSDSLLRSQINKKCILTPYVGTIGNIGIHDKAGKFHLGSNVGKIELLYSELTSEEFVVHYLKSSEGYKQLTKHMKATAQESISIEALRDVLLPLPPKEEQDNIEQKLNNIFDIIRNVEINRNDLDFYIKTAKSKILDLAIHGKLVPQDTNDEPAEELLKRIATSDNRPYEKVEDEPFELPDSWKWVKLGNICDYGKCININSSNLHPNDWILDLEDIEKDTGRIIAFHTFKERKSESTKHKFKKGQVLYSKLRPYLNKVVIAPNDGFCTSEIIPLDFNGLLLPQFAQILLMSPYFLEMVNMLTYGVKMPRLGTNDAKNMLIPLPPITEQERIVIKFESLLSLLDKIILNII